MASMMTEVMTLEDIHGDLGGPGDIHSDVGGRRGLGDIHHDLGGQRGPGDFGGRSMVPHHPWWGRVVSMVIVEDRGDLIVSMENGEV